MIGKQFDSRNKNIDNMFDMMIRAQKENGIEPTMKEALFDPVTKERINVFKRKKLELAGVDLSKYGEDPKSGSGCNKCGTCEKKELSNIKRGVFVYSEDDLIDEEDGIYVCEYCTKIGYDNGYKPEICDMCDDCEECKEYIGGMCDGCEYSLTFNDGVSYSGSSPERSSILTDEDKAIFDEIEDDEPEYEVMKPTGTFSIMNY